MFLTQMIVITLQSFRHALPNSIPDMMLWRESNCKPSGCRWILHLFPRDSQWRFLLSVNINCLNTSIIWQVRDFRLLYVRHATESRRVNLAKRHGHRGERVYSMHINMAVNHEI